MRSPILHLESSIQGVPFQIAPENLDKFMEYRDRYNISIELSNDKLFSIRVNLETNIIILPIASLEYLWAFSLYCWVLYQEYREGQIRGAEEINCVGNQRLQNAYSVLQWARKNMLTSGIEEWPKDLPAPQANPENESDIHVVNELFLCALGWMLYHEIGHIVLQHPPITTSYSEQEEKEADQFSTEWILSKLEKNCPMLRKRALGIAVGVLCLQSLEVSGKSCLNNTHPNAHDRIFSCLSKYQVGIEELIEAFSITVLQYLFHDDKNITIDVDENSFSEIFGDLLLVISRSKRS